MVKRVLGNYTNIKSLTITSFFFPRTELKHQKRKIWCVDPHYYATYKKMIKAKYSCSLHDFGGRCLVLYLGHVSFYACKWLMHWQTTFSGCVFHYDKL